jgi:L-2-hydroxyglutarate oxidase LhgO
VEGVDIIVVGAGVIGLAIAERLAGPKRDILVVERHDGFGRETSSRNSEVIHCGMYYAAELLKTQLCIRGSPMLYELCAREGIPHRKTGKIVVATDEQEVDRLQKINEQGKRNGVPGLRLISGKQVEEMEPAVKGILGLHSPESGIVDSHRLMGFLEHSATSQGVTMAYNCEVTAIQPNGSKNSRGYSVEIREANGELTVLEAGCVINAAGLHADRVAEMAGIDCQNAGYRIYPCKGEYFRVSNRHKAKLHRLIYPVPSPVHLGAHAVLGLDESLKIGPSSFYVDSLEYGVDPANQAEFLQKARRFLPFLEHADLSPDISGIRPKLYRQGEPFRDFVIREESDRGLPCLIDLVGIESPGLTSCLAIAERVEKLL